MLYHLIVLSVIQSINHSTSHTSPLLPFLSSPGRFINQSINQPLYQSVTTLLSYRSCPDLVVLSISQSINQPLYHSVTPLLSYRSDLVVLSISQSVNQPLYHSVTPLLSYRSCPDLVVLSISQSTIVPLSHTSPLLPFLSRPSRFINQSINYCTTQSHLSSLTVPIQT